MSKVIGRDQALVAAQLSVIAPLAELAQKALFAFRVAEALGPDSGAGAAAINKSMLLADSILSLERNLKSVLGDSQH